MKPSQWYHPDGFHTIDGHRIFVHESGDGPPLLCLHGTAGSSWSWHKLAPDLSKRFRLIIPDFLGFAHSDKPHDARYSVVAHSDRLEQLIQHFSLDTFHVLGHGLGAMVGTELLARAEGRLREGRDPRIHPASLFLLNAPLFPELSQRPAAERWLAGRLGELVRFAGTRNLFWQYLNTLSGPYSRPTPTEVKQLWQLLRRDEGRWLWPAQARYHKELMRRGNRWIRTLKETERPVRLVAGPEDPVAGHRLEAAFRRSLPDLRRTMIGKLGHSPHFEAPDKLLPLIEEFFGDHPS